MSTALRTLPPWATLPLSELLTPTEESRAKDNILLSLPFIILEVERDSIGMFTVCCSSWLAEPSEEDVTDGAATDELLCYDCGAPTGLAWPGSDPRQLTTHQEGLPAWLSTTLSLAFHPWELAIELATLTALLLALQDDLAATP